jgi:cytochrome b subunit of formate dehydrogenase
MKPALVSLLLYCLAITMTARVLGQEAPTNQRSDLSQPQAAAAADPMAGVPLEGSKVPHGQIRCVMCHTEEMLWEGDKLRLYLPMESLGHDVHWQNGVGCSDCHGGDHTSLNFAEAHAGMVPTAQVRQRCLVCHDEQRLELVKGVHAKAGGRDEVGRGKPLDCASCHGINPHGILPASHERSPVYLQNQVQTCGSCHPRDLETYGNTAHARGLYVAGLNVTAVCADCHGAHGIYYAADRRSTLHPANVGTTCSKCHQFVEQQLQQSVHARGTEPASDHSTASGRLSRKPVCTDCHQGHPLLSPEMTAHRPPVEDSCGNCHAGLYSRFSRLMHTKLTDHGYVAAAKCADCHGAHDILPISDPHSKLAAGANRLETCQQCHTNAVANFARYDPHANFKDASRYPGLHTVYGWIRVTLNIVFACFLAHALVWFIRALVERLQHGGHATLVSKGYALPRFGALQRALYAVLIVSFLGLTSTGLTLRYNNQSWAQWAAQWMGGLRATGDWHQFFAWLAIGAFVVHLAYGVSRIVRRRRTQSWGTIVFGPDSLLPNRRDFRDFFRMLLWFIGFSRKPGFERWAYWEKLDYWALYFVAGLIGLSGLMFVFPNLFCLVLPGSMLNIARMVHSQFALYTASFLFLIHFFHAHFRPEKFPMDMSMLTGIVSEGHLRRYRPDYIARLEREDKLNEMRIPAPSKLSLWLVFLGGVAVFAVGFWMLAVTLLASLEE